MAQISYIPKNLPQVGGAHTAIIMSKWYKEFSDSMVEKCRSVLAAAGCAEPQLHVVPGSLEIPLAAKRLAENDPALEAIIVFGVILKGDTYHFEMVKDLCMSGLERVMFECDIPVINEILPVDTLDYVAARSGDNDKNKGLEAGIAAVEIIDWRRKNPSIGEVGVSERVAPQARRA
jgi:6,7-dimethyl-8-ribityllumazine synthase